MWARVIQVHPSGQIHYCYTVYSESTAEYDILSNITNKHMYLYCTNVHFKLVINCEILSHFKTMHILIPGVKVNVNFLFKNYKDCPSYCLYNLRSL